MLLPSALATIKASTQLGLYWGVFMNETLHVEDIKVGLSSIDFKRPAIVITERDGDKELIYEFYTIKAYRAWKELK